MKTDAPPTEAPSTELPPSKASPTRNATARLEMSALEDLLWKAACVIRGPVDEPPDVREEVIVHELLHLKVPNHGKLFRQLLKSYLGRPPVLGRLP